MIGRKRPYTVDEIASRLCAGCRKRTAVHQWNCCAIDNRWVPVCLDCDFALNEMALAFFRVPDRETLLAKYRRRERAKR